jgi:2-polyprenyl-3-methyl-5-hydroxy-6-metoxy-1,4-benzoquinol methylase
MLGSYARHDYSNISAALNLTGNERVVDAGGGLGVLADILLTQQPKLNLVVLDRPEVIELASTAHTKSERNPIQWVSVDFFNKWGVSGDAVVLARVLHDWDDDKALKILNCARESLQCGGKLFIVEMLMSELNPSGALCNLHLMIVTSARERTQAQFEKLLNRTGFVLSGIKRVNALSVVLIGEAK